MWASKSTKTDVISEQGFYIVKFELKFTTIRKQITGLFEKRATEIRSMSEDISPIRASTGNGAGSLEEQTFSSWR